MMLRNIPAMTFALFGLSSSCDLENILDKEPEGFELKKELCLPQGEGDWTLSFLKTDIVFPSFDAENIWAGYVTDETFLL